MELTSQNSIASELCLSPSRINSAFKRLVTAGLVTSYHPPSKPQPIIQACEEFFAHGLKYIFPEKLGKIVRGIPTSYAAPGLNKQIIVGNEIPYQFGPMAKVLSEVLHLNHYIPQFLNQ